MSFAALHWTKRLNYVITTIWLKQTKRSMVLVIAFPALFYFVVFVQLFPNFWNWFLKYGIKERAEAYLCFGPWHLLGHPLECDSFSGWRAVIQNQATNDGVYLKLIPWVCYFSSRSKSQICSWLTLPLAWCLCLEWELLAVDRRRRRRVSCLFLWQCKCKQLYSPTNFKICLSQDESFYLLILKKLIRQK